MDRENLKNLKNLELISDGLIYKNNDLKILDQTKLPNEEIWESCNTLEDIYTAILNLKVRGAPLIAVAASLFIGKYAFDMQDKEKIINAVEYLISSRPTAVNLKNLLGQHLNLILNNQSGYHYDLHIKLAVNHFQEDVELCNKIAEHGSKIITKNSSILTHCNAGSIATVGVGTALGVIKKAHLEHKNIKVYADETRPLLQGARLTAWECAKYNIPYKIICDNMAAFLMQQKKINFIIVGADRICTNGDFANKIGTYSLAVLAKYHNIPFYVAAPYTTIDFNCHNGTNIPIEERNQGEVLGVNYNNEQFCWSPGNAKVYNPAFDVTPGKLVTGFILDTGVLAHNELIKERV